MIDAPAVIVGVRESPPTRAGLDDHAMLVGAYAAAPVGVSDTLFVGFNFGRTSTTIPQSSLLLCAARVAAIAH